MRKTLPVLFRRDTDEGRVYITAVFPTCPGSTLDPDSMECYAHIGQHAHCSQGWFARTQPASPAEYANLLAELRGIYERGPGESITLEVVDRITPAMRAELRRNARR